MIVSALRRSLVAVALTLCMAGTAFAGPIVTFDFDFFDSSGADIGDGFLSFEDIAPGTTAAFPTLSSLSWEFSITGLITLSSAAGDFFPRDAPVLGSNPFNEGILLLGVPGSRTIQFTDSGGSQIVANPAAFTTPGTANDGGVVGFNEFSNTIVYKGAGVGTPVLNGTYVSSERLTPPPTGGVPAPATLVLLAAGLLLLRRRFA